MSWEYIRKEKETTIVECLKKELLMKNEAELVCIEVLGNVGYATFFDRQKYNLYATVIITKQDKKQYYNFSYKIIHENENPEYANFPQKMFKILSPTDNIGALEWRKKCEEKHKKEQVLTKKLQHKSVIQFQKPILIEDSQSINTFTVIKNGKKTHFKHNGKYYKIKNWRKIKFDIV